MEIIWVIYDRFLFIYLFLVILFNKDALNLQIKSDSKSQ